MALRHQAGYSLIDLLVALALLGLIAVAMSGGLSFGARAWERTESLLQAREQTQGAQELLRKILSALSVKEFDPARPDEPGTFAGGAQRMDFSAVAPSAAGRSGLVRFSLVVAAGKGGADLRMFWRAERGSKLQEGFTLLGGARAVRFAYGALSQEGSVIWSETWAPDSGAPALIRVRAEFPPESIARWPELIVRPRIDKDSSCIYDAVSLGCRRG